MPLPTDMTALSDDHLDRLEGVAERALKKSIDRVSLLDRRFARELKELLTVEDEKIRRERM